MMDRYQDYLRLRKTYPCFIYDGYTKQIHDDKLCITYGFTIESLASFHP